MLLSLILQLDPSTHALWQRPGRLRALAYALFQQADPALAEELHAGDGERPFTIAVLSMEDGLDIRVTSLTEATSRALAVAMGRVAGAGQLPMERETLAVHGVVRAVPPVAEAVDYESVRAMPFAPHLALEFVTPATFSQGGDRHLPLPVPDLMLRSWARRWNRFAPPEFAWSEALIASVSEKVRVGRGAQIETVGVTRPGELVGFVGIVPLEALRPGTWSPEEQRLFASLTAYSRFCGTGARTTQGLGLTLPARPGWN